MFQFFTHTTGRSSKDLNVLTVDSVRRGEVFVWLDQSTHDSVTIAWWVRLVQDEVQNIGFMRAVLGLGTVSESRL